MTEDRRKDDKELVQLRSEVADQQRDIDKDDREVRQETLIARLREEAAVRDEELVALRERLEAAEHELEDLRAIRDALTPPELPERPGLQLAAAFVPAAERSAATSTWSPKGRRTPRCWSSATSSGMACRPARRAAFVRTTFAATAPFSDDPRGC